MDVDELLSLIKCSSCSKPASSTDGLYHCPDAHETCGKCVKDDDDRCQKCEKPLERCPLAERLFSRLPVQCRFYDFGCSNLLKGKEAEEEHSKTCKARYVNSLLWNSH